MAKRISGITYLKAILPLLVIACHIRPFGKSSFMCLPLPDHPGMTDIFYFNFCYLAVPLFFIISLFLYLKKRERTENRTKLCVARVGYFFAVFAVVRVIYVFFGIGKLWVAERGVFKNLYAILFGGGNTLLYYLQLCSYLTVFMELCCLFLERTKIDRRPFSLVGVIITLSLVLSLYFLPNSGLKTEALIYYSPVCFLPYVFVALYYSDSKNQKNIPFLSTLFLTGIIAAVFEWKFLPNPFFIEIGYGIALPSYARLSVVAMSSAIFGFMIRLTKKAPRFIEYLSSVSLYVYCLHHIFIIYVTKFIHNDLAGYFTVVILTYAFAALIRMTVNAVKSRIKR